MMKFDYQRRRQVTTSALSLLLFSLTSSLIASAEDLTIEDVIAKSKATMLPPVTYRIRRNKIESIVTQKRLANGTLGSRTEPVPDSQTIMITLGQEYYDVLPQSQIIVDKTLLSITTNEHGQSFTPEPFRVDENARREMSSMTMNGKTYFAIKTTFSSDLIERAKLLPVALQKAVEATNSLLVDAETFVPFRLESYSLNGVLLVGYEYSEISHPDAIDDSLFALPAEFTVKRPASKKERDQIFQETWKDIRPVPRYRPVVAKEVAVKDYTIVPAKIDPATGYGIPNGMTLDEVKADVKRRRADKNLQDHDILPPKARSYKLIAFINATVLFGLILLWYFRKNPKAI